MLPKYHVLLGFIFVLIISCFSKLSLIPIALIFLSSVAIDADHYLWWIICKKSTNIKKAYVFFVQSEKKWMAMLPEKRKAYKRIIFCFHGIEFIIVLFLLSLFHYLFLFVLIGVAFHLITDLIELLFHREPFYSKFSQIYVCITNKNKKKFN